MKKSVLLTTVSLIVLIVLVGCTPGVTSTTSPVPAPTAAPAPPAAQPTKAISPEDAAWAKVVEAAQKEGKLTIYSYDFPGDIGIAMGRAFEKRYNIKADIMTGRGAEFFERVKTEKRMGNMVADMTEGSTLHVINMKNAGLTVSAAELPALREKDSWVADILAMDPVDKHAIIFSFLVYTPYINTKTVKAGDEPKQWKDLLDPRWKGQMVLTDPTTSGGPQQLFVPLLREKFIDEDFLKNLYKQDLRFASALPDESRIIATGERSISIRGVDTIYSRFIAEGAPIKAITMDATVLSTETTAAFGGAPHPNAAKVFINWFISKEGQDVYGKAASASSIRKDVTNYLPPAAQITPKRLIIQTNDDTALATKMFNERYFDKLWGR